MLLIKSIEVAEVPDNLPVVNIPVYAEHRLFNGSGSACCTPYAPQLEIREAVPRQYRAVDGNPVTIAMTDDVAKILEIPLLDVDSLRWSHDELSREHQRLQSRFHNMIEGSEIAEASFKAVVSALEQREHAVRSLSVWQRIRVLFGADPFSFCK